MYPLKNEYKFYIHFVYKIYLDPTITPLWEVDPF